MTTYLNVPNIYSEQVESWRSLFFDSVRIRMRSDVPIGTALSGGLDSSSVLAAMSAISGNNSLPNSRLSSDWQHSICCSFPGSSLDESFYAKEVAESFGISFERLDIYPDFDKFSLLDSLAQVEDPYITIPTPMLETYKAVKSRGISVTLDGHGADELFSGYGEIMYAMRSTKTFSEFNEIIEIDRSSRSGIFSSRERLSTQLKLK